MEQKVLTPKKSFSRVGLALVAILLLTTVFQLAALGVCQAMGMSFTEQSWLMWVLNFAPLYLVGVPVGLVILRRVPAQKAEETTALGVGKLLMLFVMCIPIMYVGNLVSAILASALTGGGAQNPLDNFAMDNSPLKLLVMVILAPLVEEYIFRKQIIDRLGRYGEGLVIVFSGVVFGLFHGNLFQFLYACGLGMLFAYVYVRTRRLRYTVILHAAVNFFGSVLGPWAISQVDPDALTNLDEAAVADLAPGMLIYGGFVLLILALSIAGIVLLIARRKKVELHPTAEELPKGQRFKTAYLNVGVILLAVLCIVLTVLTLLS